MKSGVLVVAAAALMLAAFPNATDAKSTAWVIAGGDLGAYAVAGVTVDAWPADAMREVPPPSSLDGPAYELYPSYGIFAVAMYVSADRSEFTYYPAMDVLHYHPEPDIHAGWFRPAAEFKSAFDQEMVDARIDHDAGRLDRGPVAADFRSRELDKVQYFFTPWGAATAKPVVFAGDAAEALAMVHLVAVFQQPPAGRTAIPPAYKITYVGSGLGGELGAYSPPQDGAPGRFWPEIFTAQTPYYDTTAAMDAFIADAFQSDGETDLAAKTQASSDRAAMAVGAAMLAVAAAVLYVARRALVARSR